MVPQDLIHMIAKNAVKLAATLQFILPSIRALN